MDVLQNLLLVVSVTFLCMLSPGPDMALVMRSTLLGTRYDGLATSAGVLTGNLVHIAYCALGLGWVVAQSIVVYSVLRYLGAAYLIYLGVQSLRSAPSARPVHAGDVLDRPSPNTKKTLRLRGRPFLQGVLNNLFNPKGALFYLGVFSQLITPSMPRWHAAAMILAMMATSASFWLVFVLTLEQSWMRRGLGRFHGAVERVFGAVLIALGIRVAFYS
jgi:threonine/homoserine/homoserine lactone efflux protein